MSQYYDTGKVKIGINYKPKKVYQEDESIAAKYWHDLYVTTLKNAQDYAAKVGEDIGRLERELQRSQGYGYEKGFLDGAQHQMKSSVDKAVNSMAQRPWVGLTDEEMMQIYAELKSVVGFYSVEKYARAIEAKLKEKNT